MDTSFSVSDRQQRSWYQQTLSKLWIFARYFMIIPEYFSNEPNIFTLFWDRYILVQYLSQQCFVQYFSELPELKNLLLTILKTENTQRCSSLNKQWVESTLDPENLLYSNIQSWFDHTVIYFSERVEEYKLEQKKALPKQ